MKFSRLLSLSYSLVFAMLLGCLDSAACDTFRIGISLPLTGDGAECGVAVQNAIKLAVNDAPNNFSNIRFIYEDNKYEAKSAVTTVSKLIDVEKVNLLFIWSDLAAAATLPLTERRRVPTVTVSTDPRPTQNSRYVVRFLNAYEDYATAMLEHLRSKQLNNIGILYVEDYYHRNILDGLRKHLASDERLVTIANYQSSELDFKSTIAKIKAGSFDAIGVYLMPGQVSTFYRQLEAEHVTLPTFGVDTFESQSEITAARGTMAGAVYAHNIVDDAFRSRYLQTFGNDYQIPYAANAYAFAQLVGELFNERGSSLSAAAVIEALRAVPQRSSVAGSYSVMRPAEFAAYFKFPIGIKRIRGNAVELVTVVP